MRVFEKMTFWLLLYLYNYSVSTVRILKQSVGARNREGIGLSYWPTRAPFKEPRNRFQGRFLQPNSIVVPARQAGNRFLKGLQIRAQAT
jgi:hypothetical protein